MKPSEGIGGTHPKQVAGDTRRKVEGKREEKNDRRIS